MTGLESVFFAVAFGLLISNTIGVPNWMRPALQSEFYVKIGLVLLGTTVIFGEIMQAGALGLIQALVVVFCVWNFGYWVARKLGVDREMSTMLASAVSICGVSAAIATCGAIKGDSKKLSYVISLVLVVAIPMMYFMPYLAVWMGLTPEVAGAWMGGTIDTTGAVVASGSVLGETAEKYSVIVKFSQNVLLGIAAFAISIYWSYKGKDHREKPTAGVLWERFPKFVLGFVFASLIFSFAMPFETAKSVGSVTKNLLLRHRLRLYRARNPLQRRFQQKLQKAPVGLPDCPRLQYYPDPHCGLPAVRPCERVESIASSERI